MAAREVLHPPRPPVVVGEDAIVAVLLCTGTMQKLSASVVVEGGAVCTVCVGLPGGPPLVVASRPFAELDQRGVDDLFDEAAFEAFRRTNAENGRKAPERHEVRIPDPQHLRAAIS